MAKGKNSGQPYLRRMIRKANFVGSLSDAFTKREKANEDYAIRMREKEKVSHDLFNCRFLCQYKSS